MFSSTKQIHQPNLTQDVPSEENMWGISKMQNHHTTFGYMVGTYCHSQFEVH